MAPDTFRHKKNRKAGPGFELFSQHPFFRCISRLNTVKIPKDYRFKCQWKCLPFGIMLLPICSSVVVVTDSAPAPLFSLPLLVSHQLRGLQPQYTSAWFIRSGTSLLLIFCICLLSVNKASASTGSAALSKQSDGFLMKTIQLFL